MIGCKTILYGTPEYDEMVVLRYKILRAPLGLLFSEQDLQRDKNDILLVAHYPESNKIIGCCILTPLNDHTAQLRQMAVEEFCQGEGIGSKLLSFAEYIANEHNFKYIYLHARKEAAGFYKRHDYTIEGDQFIKVGIPHFEMLKIIKQ